MKVAFLLQDLQLSGGVGVVVRHASALATQHGFDVTLALTRTQEEPDWEHGGLAELHTMPLERAIEEHFDVAVATWWETAYHLFELSADRHAYFVQSLEDRFYPPGHPYRTAAGLTHALPVHFITEARWIADTLGRLQPRSRCFYVRNGIAKDVFRPLERVAVRTTGPLRVVVEGNPEVAFKGVPEALEAADAMAEPHHLTIVSPERRAAAGLVADRVVGPLSHSELAKLYGESDVLLKLSRVEGMFGPPLEAFHSGATCVVTPVSGHDEYVRHGWNGLVADWDDTRGTARLLDLLARDRRLLHFLRSNALETAHCWPSWEQSTQFMAAALRAIRRLPPAGGPESARRLAADLQAAFEAQRLELANKDDELREFHAVRAGRAWRTTTRVRRLWRTRPMQLYRRVTRRRRLARPR